MYRIKELENKVYAYLLFLVWPFLSIFFAFYEYRKAWAKNVVWFFVAFYAYTMVISDTEIDANRYRDHFIEVSNSRTVTVTKVISNLYTDNSENLDLLKPLLNVIVSEFTNNYKILFLVYGLIFGYFFSRNVWLLLESVENKIIKISIPLLIVFIFINPIWNINGFRFYTAAQIFVYGVFLYLLNGKRKGLFIIATTVFVHFSFIFPIIVFYLYILIGNRLTVYFYLFIASLFVNELNIEFIKSNFNFVPVVFEKKVDAYTNEDYMRSRVESTKTLNWYVTLRSNSLKYTIYAFLVFLFWKERFFIKKNKKLYNLFSFILLLFSYVNLISLIPSMGRFFVLAYSMSIALIFLCLQFLNDKRLDFMVKISNPVLLFFLIVTIRMGFDTFGVTTILGNPLFAFFMEDDFALIQLIK